jgi:Domain of unknown function (DUF4396)
MEIVDNAIMLVIPGAMEAPLDSLLFWGSLTFALVLAGVAAYPLNRWLVAAGADMRSCTGRIAGTSACRPAARRRAPHRTLPRGRRVIRVTRIPLR